MAAVLPGSRRTRILASASSAMLIAAVTPAAAAAALFSSDSPASSAASATTTTIIITFIVVAVAVVAAVAAFLRAIGTSGSAGRRTRGTGSIQTKVAGGLGLGALVLFILGVIATESVRSTDEADAADAAPLTIGASAQQWLWRYEYPIPPDVEIAPKPGIFSYYELVIPVDTPITLEVDSTDVIHNWSVPALTRQLDANPGQSPSELSFIADEEGIYEGRSNKFSGPAYTAMRTSVRVVSQAEFEDWVVQQAVELQEANAAVQERIDTGEIPGTAGGGE